MKEYIVIMPRIEGNPEISYDTQYYSDCKRYARIYGAIHHGVVELDQSDDFLIGVIRDGKLVKIQYMENERDDDDELADVARKLGYNHD